MKLTNKFWTWIGQLAAAIFLIWRIDLLAKIFGLIPNIDLSGLAIEFWLVKIAAILWLVWLIWRGVKGFTGEMAFLIDDRNRRW